MQMTVAENRSQYQAPCGLCRITVPKEHCQVVSDAFNKGTASHFYLHFQKEALSSCFRTMLHVTHCTETESSQRGANDRIAQNILKACMHAIK